MDNREVTTDIDLAMRLIALNEEGKYDLLIRKCEAGDYHDFQSSFATPKINLIHDLSEFPELADIADDVKKGVYDE